MSGKGTSVGLNICAHKYDIESRRYLKKKLTKLETILLLWLWVSTS